MSYDYDDRCYECKGYGDDWILDGNGEWVRACDDCPFNELNSEEDE